MSNGDIIISLIFIMALIGLGLGLYVLFHTDDEMTEMKYIYYNSSANITDWTYPSGVNCIDVDPQPLVLTATCKEEINRGRNITPSIRPDGNYTNEISSNITIENANAGGWGITSPKGPNNATNVSEETLTSSKLPDCDNCNVIYTVPGFGGGYKTKPGMVVSYATYDNGVVYEKVVGDDGVTAYWKKSDINLNSGDK